MFVFACYNYNTRNSSLRSYFKIYSREVSFHRNESPSQIRQRRSKKSRAVTQIGLLGQRLRLHETEAAEVTSARRTSAAPQKPETLSLQSECEITREIQQMGNRYQGSCHLCSAEPSAGAQRSSWHLPVFAHGYSLEGPAAEELVSCSRLHSSVGALTGWSPQQRTSYSWCPVRGSGTLCGTYRAEADTRKKDHG